jgi:hypothetical protein
MPGHEHIISDSFVTDAMEPARVLHTLDSSASEAWFVPARQQGRGKTPELIDQLQVMELAQHVGTPFYQQPGGPPGTEISKGFQPADPLVNEGAIPMFIGKNRRIPRQISGSGHYDAPWRQPGSARTDGQSRVIPANGFRTDKNCVHAGPETLD